MHYYIKEPENISSFYPIALNRAVHDLVLGCMTLKQRLELALDHRVEALSNRFSSYHPQMITGFVFLSHAVWQLKKMSLNKKQVIRTKNNEIIFFYADNLTINELFDNEKLNNYLINVKNKEPISIDENSNPYIHGVLHHISDIFLYHHTLLKNELAHYIKHTVYKPTDHESDAIGPYHVSRDDKLFIKKNVKIGDYVAFNTTGGTIVIEDDTQIGSFSSIEGPCFIGKNVKIDQATIRAGTVILDSCKIGGEVEESIFMPFSNKHHEGFVGHSYIGQFVNLGALTTTSDLKNNYRPVRCYFDDIIYETNQLKIGSFIGDYSTLGIGSLLTTGSCVGLGSNLFIGALLLNYKNIPSFTWKNPDHGEAHKLKQLLATIKIIMGRRKMKLSQEQETIITQLHHQKTGGV